MIKVVFAVLMISNGSVIEYVPTGSGAKGMSDCLAQKRSVERSSNAEEQDGLTIRCEELKVELYEDCVGDTCRTKIKRIIEE